MKIPFDAAEFSARLDSAWDDLCRLRNSNPRDHDTYWRLNSKMWAVGYCKSILDRHGARYLRNYLDSSPTFGGDPGEQQGFDLVRGYLREYDWGL